MLKTEFNTICESMDKNYKEISTEHYEEIEFVYMNYPIDLDKHEIANLYVRYGMGIIRDMYNRANEYHELKVRNDELVRKLNRVQQAMNDMINEAIER